MDRNSKSATKPALILQDKFLVLYLGE